MRCAAMPRVGAVALGTRVRSIRFARMQEPESSRSHFDQLGLVGRLGKLAFVLAMEALAALSASLHQ